MARSAAKHMKRINAPKSWMLSKMGGIFAPRPSQGPHAVRESIPLLVILRNRLKYALNQREVTLILKRKLVAVDGKIRADPTFPIGFMDVLSVKKSNDLFRMLFDTKGRFVLHRISEEESKFKLCKVTKIVVGHAGIPHLYTKDARTVRYPDPAIKVGDTVKIDLETGKIVEFARFELGALAFITGGNNTGRIGVVSHIERHIGTHDIVQLTDAAGNHIATRADNAFIIGTGSKPMITLPAGNGVRKTIMEERRERQAKN
ncbi:Ribosomal protein S4e [Carpediemonas membranifera]|uniref:40S ribosomal protein S4 n=1 Tax=Carpediemonas membranifera TaxID=201153 RepID=A0A8J6AU08_9EUKA|nr:Ribosomal protein S4e [Carpediemonas membranifera]|eukprot:KAG9391485.1 Ribosomal protein S4e [Carpediemonas membranifera]